MGKEQGKGGKKMKGGRVVLSAAVLVCGFVLMFSSFVQSQEVPRISKEEAVKMLGNPYVIIIDVRQGIDWKLSKDKIKGAVREEPNETDSWMEKYPKNKTLIFY